MSDDKYVRTLLDRVRRIEVYRTLNPCNLAGADNCPSAAEALFNYLNERPSRAFCNVPGQGFVDGPSVHFRRAGSLREIVERVRAGQPGSHVVVHGLRPPGARVNGRQMARDHYFSLVKLGPPQDDVFWADCSRPDAAMFYPSRSSTPPGGWTDTIDGMANWNRLTRFEYTTGPFSVRLGPAPSTPGP